MVHLESFLYYGSIVQQRDEPMAYPANSRQTKREVEAMKNIARSSKGRTTVSGTVNWGSNPCRAAR